MPQITSIILSSIAPIILIAGLGSLLDRTKVLDSRSISQIVIYLAGPSLAFYGIANSSINSHEFGQLILFALSTMAVISALAWLISHWQNMDRLTGSAFVLSIGLINCGNYGIPLNEFAFGQPGLERAIVIAMLGGIYSNTVGIFLASSGKASMLQALKNVTKVPLPYAAGLGLVVNLNDIPVPELVMQLTGILGEAAVPLMILLLGIQISRVSLEGQWRVIFEAASIRLLGGVAVGVLIALLLGLEGVTRQVAIVESSMPTAVTAAVLATEFDSDAKLVSSTILLSTLLSLVTVPFVLLYVG